MTHPLYRPSPRQTAVLVLIAALALGYGFYMRYRVIENASIGVACEGGLDTWLCGARRTALALYRPQVFGLIALGAAALNLLRPALALWAIALFTAGAGIVLYNVALSALAVALLILSLARPAPEAS